MNSKEKVCSELDAFVARSVNKRALKLMREPTEDFVDGRAECGPAF